MWISSKKGRRVLNFLYSWGASVVILGALFKLLHFPFGNEMLFVGMITEFLVFFVSGFEQPEDQYHWEQVFPELDSRNPMDREEMEARRKYLLEKAQQARAQYSHYAAETVLASSLNNNGTHGHSSISQTESSVLQNINDSSFPKDQVERLSLAIDQLSEAATQLSRLGQLSTLMTQQWEDMAQDSSSINQQTQSYKEQMENLQRNISGLNTIYEIQLKSVSGQIDTIDHINSGLNRIRNMYDSTVVDSSTFQKENERLAIQLSELNRVYARILEALTTNMNMGANGVAGQPFHSAATYTNTSSSYTETSTTKSDNIKA